MKRFAILAWLLLGSLALGQSQNFNTGLSLIESVADFPGGTYSSTGGPGGQAGDGYTLIPSANSPQTFTFAPVSSGKLTARFWYRDLSTQSGSANHNWFIYLLDVASAPSSANARGTIIFNREIGTSTTTPIQIRDNDSFIQVDTGTTRGVWRQMEMCADIDNDTYDVYVQGRREYSGALSKMTTGPISRVVIAASNAAAFSLQFAGMEIFTGSRDTLTPVVDQGFRTPATNIANLLVKSNERATLFPQYWQTSDNPALGNWTKTTTGLAPGTGVSILMADMGPSGQWDATFTTGATGNNYLGLIYNAYEGTGTSLGTEDACYIFRYANAAASDVALFRGSTVVASNPTATGVTIGANEVHTLSVVKLEGSNKVLCKIDDAVQFGGPVTLDSTNQQRGLCGETWAGVFHDAALGSGNDRCTGFKFSETPQPWRETLNTGQLTAVLKPTCVRELYLADSGSTQNLYSGKGIQQQHRAAVEGSMDRAARLLTTIDTPRVKSRTMIAQVVNASGDQGEGESITTMVGNRIWVFEKLTARGSTNSYTTDNDYRSEGLETNGVAVIGATGAASTFNPLANHDWTSRVGAGSLPMGHQVLFEYRNGRAARMNAMMVNVGAGALTAYSMSKHKGHDPLSITLGVSSVSAGTTVQYAIGYLAESISSAAMDTATLAAWRDDLKNPTGWTVGTGVLKTNDAGDLNADGFDETLGGWWTFTAAGGEVSITNGAVARVQPVFRVYGLGAQAVVRVAGARLNNDQYIVQPLADGSTVVALLVNVPATAGVTITPQVLDVNVTAIAGVTQVAPGSAPGALPVLDANSRLPSNVQAFNNVAAATPGTAGGVPVLDANLRVPSNVQAINNVAAATPGTEGGLPVLNANLLIDTNLQRVANTPVTAPAGGFASQTTLGSTLGGVNSVLGVVNALPSAAQMRTELETNGGMLAAINTATVTTLPELINDIEGGGATVEEIRDEIEREGGMLAGVEDQLGNVTPAPDTRDFEEPQLVLRIAKRDDGKLYSPDKINIAPGEQLVVGFDCRPDGRPTIVCPGRSVVAQVGDPSGLSGDLSATKVGTDGRYAKARVVADAEAEVGTSQWMIIEVTNSFGDGPTKLSAEVVVRAASGG